MDLKTSLLFVLCFFSLSFAQNPFDKIGQQHNRILEEVLTSNLPIEKALPIPLNYSFNNYTTYGDPQVFVYLEWANLPHQEKQSLLQFLQIPDDLPVHQAETLIDSLEKEAIKRKASPILLGFWSVAKNSLRFWKKYPWGDEDKKPPFMAIVKADALGLIKGLVLGALFWVGSSFIADLPDTIGIVGGSTIAVGFTALDSIRFSKKYKKRTES